MVSNTDDELHSIYSAVYKCTTRGIGGVGVAYCPSLNLLAYSWMREGCYVTVCSAPSSLDGFCVRELYTFGGDAVVDMDFKCSGYGSGFMAFTQPEKIFDTSLLMITCAGQGTIHIVDLVSKMNVGHIKTPAPRGIATRKSFMAVSCWDEHTGGVVKVFKGDQTNWTLLYTTTGNTRVTMPFGLRFAPDGLSLVIADYKDCSVKVLNLEDWSIRIAVNRLGCIIDVEVCRNRLFMTCSHSCWCEGNNLLETNLGGHDTAYTVSELAKNMGGLSGMASALGLGLFVRDHRTIRLFATTDDIAMSKMSALRVAWIRAVVSSFQMTTI